MQKYIIPIGVVVVISLIIFGFTRSRPANNQPIAEESTHQGAVLSDNSSNNINNQSMTTYQVDPSQSTIQWNAKKRVGAAHTGKVQFKSGGVMVDDGQLSSAIFVIDMTSIDNEDLQDSPAMQDKLLTHLNSDDFFSTAQHPETTFEIKSVSNGNITGPLTIKGITNEITAPATINVSDDQVTIQSNLVFDRSKWDVRFGSDAFFDNLGDNLIENDVNLSVNVTATK